MNIIGSRIYLEDYDDGEVIPELVDDNAKLGNGIGTCSTSTGTALEVTLANYKLVKNGIVAVTFEYDVPANATLNINNKGAKPIYNEGSAIEADVIKTIGEKLYISAYKRFATVTINSIHIYEVNAIADKAIEILGSIPENSQYYSEAQEYIRRLALFENLDEGLIPDNSLIREFIGQGRLSDKPTVATSANSHGRVINDIRFFAETSADGIDLRRDCRYCCPRRTLAATERLLCALRERNFSLPDIGRFSYLYINFTTRLPEGHSKFIPELPICSGEFDWFRYVDVGVSQATYDSLGQKSGEWYLQSAVNVITAHFCHTEDERNAVYRMLTDIIAQGSDFRVLYKKKETASMTACVYAGISDEFRYIPTVIVTDKEGNVLLEKSMEPQFHRENFANQYGSLLLNKKRVLIRPRKNELSKDLQEIILPIGEA